MTAMKPITKATAPGGRFACKCGHVWVSRVPVPKACPRCKQYKNIQPAK